MESNTGQEPTEEQKAAAAQAEAAARASAEAEAKKKAEEDGKTFDAAYVRELRAEAAASRVKLKEFETAEAARKTADEAKKLAEMTETDRLKKQLADAEAKARTLEIQQVRTKAAAKHALPEDLHEFITAEDEAGALAQAEKLAAKLKPAAGLPGAGGRQPANTSDAGNKALDAERLTELQSRVPSLRGRKIA